MKKIVRLTESDLHRIVKESVKKIIREFNPDEDYDYPSECPYCGSDNIECVGGLGVSEKWVCHDCDEYFEPYDFPEPPQGDGANGACLWQKINGDRLNTISIFLTGKK